MHRPFVISAALAAGAFAAPLGAGTVVVTYTEPTLDRWNYPFNFTPGTRGSASTFSASPDPTFDDRDGQILLGWDTAADVTPGLGRRSYAVTSAVLTIMVESDGTFDFDPTQDPWESYLPDAMDPEWIADPDAGRPVELYGVGFRNGWTLTTYEESSPFCLGCSCAMFCVDVRNVFAVDLDPFAAGRDVTNNVKNRFEVLPFAVGQAVGVAAGAPVPTRTDMVFDLDVADPAIACHLADGLDQGRLDLMVTSQHLTEMMGAGTFPTFFMKESIDVPSTADPARLALTVEIDDTPAGPGDANDDGGVDIDDVIAVILVFGSACPCCDEDLDGNGVIDIDDVVTAVLNFD